MVKFIGGPSISAYKNYRNHTIARPGQFRMPRNYGYQSTRTTIIMNSGNYGHNHCGGYRQNSYMNFMNFMNLMPMIGNFFTNLFGLFAPKQQTQTDTTPPSSNLFANSDPITTTKTYTPTSSTSSVTTEPPANNDGDNQDINATGNITYSTTTTPATPEEELTVAVEVPKGKTTDGTTTYHGWKTLLASYKDNEGNTIPFTDTNFRNWFRNKYLTKDGETAHIWKEGETQNFPKSFEYNGKTYTFNQNTFNNPLDTYTTTGNVNTGNMARRTTPGTAATTTTTYKGSVTVAGKTFNVTGETTEDKVKTALKTQIKADTTLTEQQKQAALAQVDALTATEEQTSS